MSYDLVTIVCAARGMPALRTLLAELPSTFSAPIVCLAQSHARLDRELQAATRLKVSWAEGDAPLEKGHVYLSPPHASVLFSKRGAVSISPFGPESSALSPVDQFLASAAAFYRERVACLVLAGFERDGVAGARTVRDHGGGVLILDRATALYWGMAEPIIRAGAWDRVLSLEDLAEALRVCFAGRGLLHCAEIVTELGGVLEVGLRLSGTWMGHIAHRRPGSRQMHILVKRGLDTEFLEHFDPIRDGDDTACVRAARSGTRVVIPDVTADAAYVALRNAARPFLYRAVHATPLFGSNEVHGVVAALFAEPHRVSAREADLMDGVAAQAAKIVAHLEGPAS